MCTRYRPKSVLPSLGAVALLFAAPAFAGDITVNTTNNELVANGVCSLREAMQSQFNGAPFNGCTGATAAGPNKIKFSVNGTITVAQQLADVIAARDLEVTGSGQTVTIACMSNRLFESESGSFLYINNVTLQGCTTSGAGLAINSQNADLSLTNVTVKNFISNTGVNGAAIAHSGGNLFMTNVTMQGNKIDDGNAATFNGNGGALAISNVELPNIVSIQTTTFDSNRADKNGGAVYINNDPSLGHSITFTASIFNSNTAVGNSTQDGGGAVWIQSGDDANDLILFTANLFSGNTATNGAGGAVLLALGSRVSYLNANVPSAGGFFASHFVNNTAGGPAGNDGSGGAIFSRGELSVVQSSFHLNKSTNGSGGAIAIGNNAGVATLANVTISGNTAKQNGGAIARLGSSGSVALINTTLSGNTATGTGASGGGVIYNSSAASGITSRNSIFGNSSGVGGNCQGFVQNLGNNLQYSPNTGCGTPAFAAGDPILTAFAPSAGPNVQVWTMRLDSDYSIALNAGDNATCNAGPMLKFDATGIPTIRPTNGPFCDIGAFESAKKPDIIFRHDFQ
jgi:CSLREA domain-containing protein